MLDAVQTQNKTTVPAPKSCQATQGSTCPCLHEMCWWRAPSSPSRTLSVVTEGCSSLGIYRRRSECLYGAVWWPTHRSTSVQTRGRALSGESSQQCLWGGASMHTWATPIERRGRGRNKCDTQTERNETRNTALLSGLAAAGKMTGSCTHTITACFSIILSNQTHSVLNLTQWLI